LKRRGCSRLPPFGGCLLWRLRRARRQVVDRCIRCTRKVPAPPASDVSICTPCITKPLILHLLHLLHRLPLKARLTIVRTPRRRGVQSCGGLALCLIQPLGDRQRLDARAMDGQVGVEQVGKPDALRLGGDTERLAVAIEAEGPTQGPPQGGNKEAPHGRAVRLNRSPDHPHRALCLARAAGGALVPAGVTPHSSSKKAIHSLTC
jgi:hypothetical protein